MDYKYFVMERRDIKKIDKLNVLRNKDTFWNDVKKLTKKTTSDHALDRWQCLAESRWLELLSGYENIRVEFKRYGEPFKYYLYETGKEIFIKGVLYKMIETTFMIDDCKYLRNKWRKEGVPECNISNVLASMPPSVIGTYVVKTSYNKRTKKTTIRKRTFYNTKGQQRRVNGLSPYVQSVIIEQCDNYVLGTRSRIPHGVIDVQSKEIRKVV